jgi:hypothetical protein
MQLRASDRRTLAKLAGEIHDAWLDVESLQFDSANRILTMTLLEDDRSSLRTSLISSPRTAKVSVCLAIASALDFTLNDSEKVRYYDVSDLMFEEDVHRIVFLTGIPLEFSVRVERLDLLLSRNGADG